MPRSVYFGQNVKSEKWLYEDLIIESIKVYGFDMYYLPRTIVSQDKILNEDTESQFNHAYPVEMYIESVEGYEGDGVLMSKFGLQIRNQLKVAVARRTWELKVNKNLGLANKIRPSEGDLIYIPGINGLFEIKFAELESPFHQLNNLPVYKMSLELFEYRGEDMNTGIEEVDAIQLKKSLDSSYRAVVEYTTNSTEHYDIGESIVLNWPSPSTITGTAKIIDLKRNLTETELIVTFGVLRFTDGKVHPLTTNVTATGNKTGAIGKIVRVIDLSDGDEALNDGNINIQNNSFETRANDIIDFTQVNPFGEPDK